MSRSSTVVSIERAGSSDRRDLEPGQSTEIVSDGPIAVTVVAGSGGN